MESETLCRNCGDRTSFPTGCDSGRACLQWCEPCYSTARKHGDYRQRNSEYREKALVWKQHMEHTARLKREAQERRRRKALGQ